MKFSGPIQFQPVFRDYLWGGNRLATRLGKATGPGVWAESWEVVDHDSAQSIVISSEGQGLTLGELMRLHGPEIVGEEVWQRINAPNVPPTLKGRFPLLLKFLDAAKDLSVQVHPDDELAAQLTPPDLGKSEAWYVMDAAPGATIYAGLKSGITRERSSKAVSTGRTAEMLHSFQPKQGDCIFIPAGTMHAIGAGLLILEIQQASNTTWRVFDWNRLDANGKSRDLHIDQAMIATDFSAGPVHPVVSEMRNSAGRELLVECQYFQMVRWQGSESFQVGGDGRMHIIAVTGGEFEIGSATSNQKLVIGETRLVPASCKAVSLRPAPGAELIEITI